MFVHLCNPMNRWLFSECSQKPGRMFLSWFASWASTLAPQDSLLSLSFLNLVRLDSVPYNVLTRLAFRPITERIKRSISHLNRIIVKCRSTAGKCNIERVEVYLMEKMYAGERLAEKAVYKIEAFQHLHTILATRPETPLSAQVGRTTDQSLHGAV